MAKNVEDRLEEELKQKRAQREAQKGPEWPAIEDGIVDSSGQVVGGTVLNKDFFDRLKEYIDHGDRSR